MFAAFRSSELKSLCAFLIHKFYMPIRLILLDVITQIIFRVKGDGKAVPVQAWTGPGGSSRLKLPDFMTIGSDALAAFTHQEIFLVLISVGARGGAVG
jgi:hypothetical protein